MSDWVNETMNGNINENVHSLNYYSVFKSVNDQMN